MFVAHQFHQLVQALIDTRSDHLLALVTAASKFHLGTYADVLRLANVCQQRVLRAPTPVGLYQLGQDVLVLVRDDTHDAPESAQPDAKLRINVFMHTRVEGVTDLQWVWMQACHVIKRDPEGHYACWVRLGCDGHGRELSREEGVDFMFNAACQVACALEAFFLPGASTQERLPSRALNAQRAACGQAPLYGYRTLVEAGVSDFPAATALPVPSSPEDFLATSPPAP